jgi:hypothetical protein
MWTVVRPPRRLQGGFGQGGYGIDAWNHWIASRGPALVQSQAVPGRKIGSFALKLDP